MKARSRHNWSPPRYERGVAAVELALLSMVLFFFLTAPLLVARSVLQATLVQRAAYNAAHMLATYPQYLRLDPAYPPIEQASEMLIDSLNGTGLGPVTPDDVSAYCVSSTNCNKASSPTDISLSVSISVLNPNSIVPSLETVQLSVGATDRFAN